MEVVSPEEMKLDPAVIKKQFECSLLRNAIARSKTIKRNFARVRGLNPLTDEYCRAITQFYEVLEQGAALYQEHLQLTLTEWDSKQNSGMITHDEREHAFNLFRDTWEKHWMPMFHGV